MILYNVTIKVDWSIHQDWLQWLKEDYIPGVMASGLFNGKQVVRLLEVDETDGPTYAVQYYANSLDEYNSYLQQESEIQNAKEIIKWGNKFVSFSTIMEVVH